MDKQRILTALRSALTSWAMALGSCRCIAACFRLETPRGLPVLCCILALGCTFAMLIPRSGRMLLPLGCLVFGYFSRQKAFRFQFSGVFLQIAETFHSAYGWKVPVLSAASRECFFPLLVLGFAVALAVTRSVCRRKSIWPGVLLAGGSLALCVMAPDPAPPRWALFLLLESLGVLLFTGQVRQQTPRQENRLGCAAALALGIFLGGILLLNPPESYVNRSEVLRQRLSLAVGRMPGESALRLALLLETVQAPREISLPRLGPRQSQQTPVLTVTAQYSGPLYLRQRHYDRYDGAAWTAASRRTEDQTPAGPGVPVTLRTQRPQPLLLLPHPCAEAVTFTGGAAENRALLTEYTLLLGSAAAEAPDAELLLLPEETQRAISAEFPKGLSPEAVVTLLAGGRYTLSPAEFDPSEGDFALWFLRNGMEGYCVHFAATAAVLLRGSGIPARLVTGYLVETEAGIPLTVTQGHAHAWAEYYDVQSRCWQILEATPVREERAAPVPAATETAPEEPVPARKNAPVLLALSVCLIPAAILAVTLPGLLRRCRLRQGSANVQALRRWQEALRLSCLLGETPYPELHTLAQKARFSPHPLTEGELAEFDSYLRCCRVRLRKISLVKRLVLTVFHGVY